MHGKDAMEHEDLIRFLNSKIQAELDLARGARLSPARDACFHRAAAYCDVLAQLDPEQAEAWRIRLVEEH